MLTLNGVGVWFRKQIVSEKNNGHYDMYSREVMHTEEIPPIIKALRLISQGLPKEISADPQ